MASRYTWKGSLRLSLITIPVRAYNAATSTGPQVPLHLLHESCHSRIEYAKVCPIHGEVSNDEIVKGYEYAPDQYAIIDPQEVDKLRTENDRAITIDSFIHPDDLDPIYFSGKTYYLTPDGAEGQKAYGLLQHAMLEKQLQCIAQMVLAGREQVVLLRPMSNLIAMSVLNYAAEIKSPGEFEQELGTPRASKEEAKLTRTLIEAITTKKFDLASYHDLYVERLRELIESKIEGREIAVAPTSEEPRHVVNLMDALKASLAKTKGRRGKTAAKRSATPARKLAVSARQRTTSRRKKTG